MNQVMINAVELDMLMSEIKYLKKEIEELKKLLAQERARVKELEDGGKS